MGILKIRRRQTALAAGLAALSMAAGLAAVPAQAVDKTKYVALGDSYAAGQGAGPYKNDDCYRSENAYSELAADVKAIKLVKNAACSGHTTQDVVNDQLNQLNRTTELVTITAGGNNLGFGAIITACGAAMAAPSVAAAAACNTASTDAAAMIASGQLAAEVGSMIQTVKSAAPNAKIVVTGYPYLYDPAPLNSADPMSVFIYRAKELADGLNGSIADAVRDTDTEATEIEYVDVRAAFAGHGIISDDPWINGATGTADSFHPNAEGYVAYYKALSKAEVYSAR